MKILVVGSGGREHALVWKLQQELGKSNVLFAPGNAGVEDLYRRNIKPTEFGKLFDLAREEKIGMTIVGPEDPLALGIVDYFSVRGASIFGPSERAAKLESSKVFAKRFMTRHRIPTADFIVADSDDDVIRYGKNLLKDYGAGVLKADGLAAGKGVVVYRNEKELYDGLSHIRKLRPNDRVIVEKCLKGEEVSFKVWTDGEHIIPMIPTQDHKAVFDGDKGPNTGGMGAYTNPVAARGMEKNIISDIIKPVIEGMAENGRLYKSVLYGGLMIVEGRPLVIEFNCRYGDPEAEVIIPLLKSSLAEISQRCIDGTLNKIKAEWEDREALDVVLATEGYPGNYEENLNRVIYGLEEAEAMRNVLVFHAGTKRNEKGQLVNSGGRVLNIVGKGRNLPEARNAAYPAADIVYRSREQPDGARFHFRRDIGYRSLR